MACVTNESIMSCSQDETVTGDVNP